MNSSIALGCSHTYGVGVEPDQAWPSLLGLTNLGKPGCSTDYCARTLEGYLRTHTVDTVYILYPNKDRFEYIEKGKILQSLSTDRNRIMFMETHDEAWCEQNYFNQRYNISELCRLHGALLVDLELTDITVIIDNADRWPKGTDGAHYNPQWHRWVADLFLVRQSFLQYAKTR